MLVLIVMKPTPNIEMLFVTLCLFSKQINPNPLKGRLNAENISFRIQFNTSIPERL